MSSPSSATSLLQDIVAVFLWPDRLFPRLSQQNRWAVALLVLMVAQALYGWALLTTGVPDYDIAVRTQREITKAANRLQGDDTSEELARTTEALEKGETFSRLFARVMLLVAAPLRLALGVVVVASALFVMVAMLQKGKPDWTLLVGVVTFATFVEVGRLMMRLFLIGGLHYSRVETSAAAFVSAPHVGLGLFLILRRLDPFDFWYWALIGYGLCKTGQLNRGWAGVVVVGFALVTAGGLCCIEVPDLAEINFTMNVDSP
jgi:hypothetical protein